MVTIWARLWGNSLGRLSRAAPVCRRRPSRAADTRLLMGRRASTPGPWWSLSPWRAPPRRVRTAA